MNRWTHALEHCYCDGFNCLDKDWDTIYEQPCPWWLTNLTNKTNKNGFDLRLWHLCFFCGYNKPFFFHCILWRFVFESYWKFHLQQSLYQKHSNGMRDQMKCQPVGAFAHQSKLSKSYSESFFSSSAITRVFKYELDFFYWFIGFWYHFLLQLYIFATELADP